MEAFNLLADVWSWLVPAVIIVVYVISHLWSAAQGNQQQQQQRKNQPQRRKTPPPERALGTERGGGGEAAPSNQGQLNAEIEQFLKRANQRRMEKARREGGPRSAQSLDPPPVEVPVDVEPLERHDFDAVSASVRRHLGGGAFEERAAHLAEDIQRSEEGMTRHLSAAFDHQMGTLGTSDLASPEIPVPEVKPPDAAGERAAAAQAIAGLLINRQNIRQAVLLKEILERPIDRW